jgi:DGQHR domain-containing protein
MNRKFTYQNLPAYKATMGVGDESIEYYLASMEVGNFLDTIKLAKEVNQYSGSKTLSEKLQRGIKESRARREIAKYLALTEGRFMPSFVVAVFDSNPVFSSVKLDETHETSREMISVGADEQYGVLRLRSDSNFFVLDGQHRLSALRFLDQKEYTDKSFIRKERSAKNWDPKKLREDDLSVLFIANREMEDKSGRIDDKKFKAQARKIFTVINRHAKPTTQEDNITMDETDLAAIITRDLIEKHDKAQGIFYWDGIDPDTKRVNTDTPMLKQGSQYLTTLQAIYEMNKYFIGARGIFQWQEDEIVFCFDKSEEEIQNVKDTLDLVWDEMIEAFSFWKLKNSDPTLMKDHTPPEEKDKDINTMDHLLFWPVGQMGVAQYLALEMGKFASEKEPKSITKKEIQSVLAKLENVDWNLFSAPWKGIALHQKPTNLDPTGRKAPTKFKWTMPSSGSARNEIHKNLDFLTGVNFNDKNLTDEFRSTWDSKVQIYRPQQKELDALWKEIEEHRFKVSGIKF